MPAQATQHVSQRKYHLWGHNLDGICPGEKKNDSNQLNINLI